MEQRTDIESIDDNRLTFWYEHWFDYPILSWLVRSIYSIPATIANVERQFDASGMIISTGHTRLNPERVNNAMFLCWVKQMNDWLLFFILQCLCFSISAFLVKNVHEKGDVERVLENVESFLSREEYVP